MSQSFILRHNMWLELKGNQAFYQPLSGKIIIPRLENFQRGEHFLSVFFHEAAHWIGYHADLEKLSPIEEECVAEITALILSAAHSSLDYAEESCIKKFLEKNKSRLKSDLFIRGFLRANALMDGRKT